MADTPLSRAPATAQRVIHDVRAVIDVCDIDLDRAGASGTGASVVLSATPDPHSGSATIPGVFIDGETGRPVDRAGGPADLSQPPMLLREGRFQILTVLAGSAARREGRYSWMQPLVILTRGVSRQAIFDPFALGGTVVCRYYPGAAAAPFEDIRLLPEGWQTQVADAVQVARRAAEQQPAAPPAGAELRDQAESANPILFAQSINALAKAGRIDSPLLASLYDKLRGYRRAVLHVTTLRHPPPDTAAVVRNRLEADLAGTDQDRRRAAALGLLAARLFAPTETVRVVSGSSVLERPDTSDHLVRRGDDGYVLEAFRTMSPS
jgi:hypothetical protein